MIGKVIAYYGIPRIPCPSGHFPSHENEHSRMKSNAASFCPDVSVPGLSCKKGGRHV